MYVQSYESNKERKVYQLLDSILGNSDRLYEYRKNLPEYKDEMIEKLQKRTKPELEDENDRNHQEENIHFHRFTFYTKLEKAPFRDIADFIVNYFQSAECFIAIGYSHEETTYLDIFMHESFINGTGYEAMEDEILEKSVTMIGKDAEIRYTYRIYHSFNGKERKMECRSYVYEDIPLEQLSKLNAELRKKMSEENIP